MLPPGEADSSSGSAASATEAHEDGSGTGTNTLTPAAFTTPAIPAAALPGPAALSPGDSNSTLAKESLWTKNKSWLKPVIIRFCHIELGNKNKPSKSQISQKFQCAGSYLFMTGIIKSQLFTLSIKTGIFSWRLLHSFYICHASVLSIIADTDLTQLGYK